MKRINTVVVMACICAISVIGMVIALASSSTTTKQEFVLPPFDVGASSGIPNVTDFHSWSELDADAFKVGITGKIVIENSSADIWLTNPEGNTVWLKLRIMDENGNILGETGLITPGQYIQSVAIVQPLQAGTPVILKVMAYEPETYHSAGSITINTTLE